MTIVYNFYIYSQYWQYFLRGNGIFLIRHISLSQKNYSSMLSDACNFIILKVPASDISDFFIFFFINYFLHII